MFLLNGADPHATNARRPPSTALSCVWTARADVVSESDCARRTVNLGMTYLAEHEPVPERVGHLPKRVHVVQLGGHRLAEKRALQSGSFTRHDGRVVYAVEDTRDEGDEVRLEDLDVFEET